LNAFATSQGIKLEVPVAEDSEREDLPQVEMASKMNAGEKVSVRLDGDNYPLWAFQVKVYLRTHELLAVVDGSAARPRTDDAAWVKQDGNAQLAIMSTLTVALSEKIMACDSAAAMWSRLAALYSTKSEVDVSSLLTKFYTLKYVPGDKMVDHVSRVEALVKQLQDAGHEQKPQAVMTQILRSLPPEYDAVNISWDNMDQDKQTVEALTSRLRKMESLLADRARPADIAQESGSELLYLGARGGGGGNRTQGRGAPRRGGQGHKRQPAGRQGGGKSQAERSGASATTMQCYRSDKIGHGHRDCPTRASGGASRGGYQQAAVAQRAAVASDPANVFGLHIAEADTAQVASSWLPDERTGWISDSGASSHITSRRDWFSRYREFAVDERVKISLGNNQVVHALGTGDVPVEALLDGEWRARIFTDVWYVPTVPKNLFSVPKACLDGARVSFERPLSTVSSKLTGEVICQGIMGGGNLFRLLVRQPQLQACLASAVEDERRIHLRFGHIGISTIRATMKAGKVLGLPKTCSNEDWFCESCQLAKQTRASFSLSASRAREPGEFLHFDTVGPMQTASVGGALYVLHAVDDNTGRDWVRFMATKDEAPSKLEDIIIEAEAESRKVRRVRSDNALEYVGKPMRVMLKRRSVYHEFSSPRCPEQNGRSERPHRTLFEQARAIMLQVGLPANMWPEAVVAASDLRNHMGSKRLGWCSPLDVYSGTPHDVSRFRELGATAYVYADKPDGKFGARAEKMVLLRSAGSKGYVCWQRGTRRVITTPNVRIVESDLAPCTRGMPQDEDDTVFDESSPGGDEPVAVATTSSETQRTKRAYNKRPAEPTERITRSQATSITAEEQAESQDACHDDACVEYHACVSLVEQDPRSHREAMGLPNSAEWRIAEGSEIKSLTENEVFELVDRPAGVRPVKGTWLHKTKSDGRKKARWVAKGYSQVPGRDFGETYAPVATMASIRVALSVGASSNFEFGTFDVSTAFLYGELEHEIYCEQPEGWEDGSNRVWRLRRSLYGLKQSPRQWNAKFGSVLRKFGLEPTTADPCVFVNQRTRLTLVIYVDDGFVMAPRAESISELMRDLEANFKITVTDAREFLGLEIKRKRGARSVKVHQRRYAEKLLARHGMLDCQPSSTPFDASVRLVRGDPQNLPDYPYREVVGGLQWLAIMTMPQLAYPVGQLSQYLDCYGMPHIAYAKRVLRFVKGSLGCGLVYGAMRRGFRERNRLVAYSDADFASCEETRRSVSGVVLMLNGGPVMWCSRKQTSVSTSTLESEYIASGVAAREVVWMRRLLDDIGARQAGPTRLWCDNQGAIALVDNFEIKRRSKHIDVQHHYVREQAQLKVIDVKYVNTSDNLADLFTKALGLPKFRELCFNLNLV
jgi:transposase InsO family protein